MTNWFGNANKPPMDGFVSGRQARPAVSYGSGKKCKKCGTAAAQVRMKVPGMKAVHLCRGCAGVA